MSQQSVKIGNFELFTVETGRFMLDGGAMFGVVPKTLWSRKIPADDKNRIPMAARCLLIKSSVTGKLYLIDTGCGDKFNEKMSDIYGLDFEHSNLDNSLDKIGIKKSEITDIIFTHLHFDHCGGTTSFNKNGDPELNFKNATFHVNKRHWEIAINPNAREKASFFPENLEPIKNSGRLNLVKDRHKFEEGLTTIPADGHTIGQQLPFIYDKHLALIYTADLIPTAAHVPLPWIMGYDMSPIQTLEEKEVFLDEAAGSNWYLYLEHDANNEVIQIAEDNGKYEVKKTMNFSDLA